MGLGRALHSRQKFAGSLLWSKQPLAAHRVPHLPQRSAQQLLGWNRWTTQFGLHLVEPRREFLEYLVYHRADRPQRMISACPLFRRNVSENVSCY
jgi:hypothetical protein